MSELVELPATNYLDLLDWRRRVNDLFGELRRRPPTGETLAWFRGEKDRLYREHPQSPVATEQRGAFNGLQYWPFDSAARIAAQFVAAEEIEAQATMSAEGQGLSLLRIGRLDFAYSRQPCSLDAFWINGYAGGLFVPFRDASNGVETYPGGRYLLDTSKSADFGSKSDSAEVVLDFNYAYHPSCTFDARWVCPLGLPAGVARWPRPRIRWRFRSTRGSA